MKLSSLAWEATATARCMDLRSFESCDIIPKNASVKQPVTNAKSKNLRAETVPLHLKIKDWHI